MPGEIHPYRNWGVWVKKLKFEYDSKPLHIPTLSISVVAHPDNGSTLEELRQTADAAM